MSLVTKYWIWESAGTHYYGMPLLNLVGWYVTGLALMAALTALHVDKWVREIPIGWFAAFYGANLTLFPLGCRSPPACGVRWPRRAAPC